MEAAAVPSSPPASSKTHAFFASSFAVSPPPRPPPSNRKRDSSSSTLSSSSATTQSPSTSPTRSIFSPTSPGFHISRIFPSRYTSNSRDSSEAQDLQSAVSTNSIRRKPEFLSLEPPDDDALSDSIESTSAYSYNSFAGYGRAYHHLRDDYLGFGEGVLSLPTPAYGYERDHANLESDAPLSSSSSSTSSSSSHVSIRLPTPPPPPLLTPSDHLSSSGTEKGDDINEFTPRPANYEPSLSTLLRPFVPEPISKAPSMVSTASTEDSHDHGSEAQEAGDLHEGDIISPSTGGTRPTSPSSSHFTTSEPYLRLVQPLGQGAFSAVWLAEDLSPVPLALASMMSVRDLKRQASLQSKGGLSRKGSLKSSVSRSGSGKGSSWGMGSRNSSFSKLKARLKGMKPVGVGKDVLDEHDVAGLLVGGSSYVDDHGSLRRSPTPGPSKTHQKQESAGSLDISWGPGTGASVSRSSSTKQKQRTVSSSSSSAPSSRLVAVKLTPRRPVPYSPQAQERTRIGFVREVEVLRHISHPNITPLLSFLSTPAHHVLVLPYLRGGDLLSLVNDDRAWTNLSEGVLRRIWCEICRGVGWMHSVGLVHRDVKLENVLVTWEGVRGMQDAAEKEEAGRASSPEPPTRFDVDDLPTPLIKLTDFGLSRFIDIGNGERGQGEMLSTRCGSEAYAAPELVMGSSSHSYSTPEAASIPSASVSGSTEQPKQRTPQQTVVSQRKGVYDARETDAWACGVVLYALVGRRLPFGEGVSVDGGRIGGERAGNPGAAVGRKAVSERRRWLMRIAKGEWEWPEAPSESQAGEELVGLSLPRSEGARRIVSRLLVRDPRKRARIVDLWEDAWMREDAVGRAIYESLELSQDGEGADNDVIHFDEGLVDRHPGKEETGSAVGESEWEPLTGENDEEDESDYFDPEEEGEEEEEEGWLLDEEGIASIARQEVV